MSVISWTKWGFRIDSYYKNAAFQSLKHHSRAGHKAARETLVAHP